MSCIKGIIEPRDVFDQIDALYRDGCSLLTRTEIEFQADQAWTHLIRNPLATFEDWAKLKDFTPEDKIAICFELEKSLGRNK